MAQAAAAEDVLEFGRPVAQALLELAQLWSARETRSLTGRVTYEYMACRLDAEDLSFRVPKGRGGHWWSRLCGTSSTGASKCRHDTDVQRGIWRLTCPSASSSINKYFYYH